MVGQTPHPATRATKNAISPVVRVSKGRFDADRYEQVKKLIDDSAATLIPALQQLHGLLYYHAGVDPQTNTVVNVSVWESVEDAKQMDTLQAMLAQRPILESAGVQFDKIANYDPAWKMEGTWSFGESIESEPVRDKFNPKFKVQDGK